MIPEDPTRIDWAARQAAALIPFEVVDGRPLNPYAPTGIRYGRNELGHWGEQVCADAIVTAHVSHSGWRLLMIERDDGHGWALPGGKVDPGEDAHAAAVRELREETGLVVHPAAWRRVLPARYVPDPRASDEAWMVTTVAVADLGGGSGLPPVTGGDGAGRAAWVRADSYDVLTADLHSTYGGCVFAAHQQLLQEWLGTVSPHATTTRS
jgi:8-oxo-dGTP pyrophosphatase MutT (NUDIX family)